MSISQQKLREIVFQLIYSFDIAQGEIDEVAPFLMHHNSVTKKDVFIAQEKQNRVLEHQKEIDAIIEEASVEYAFNRIPRTERNILRLGVFELCFAKEVPPKVAIAEAMRLTRRYAGPESSTFVNAILDTIYKQKNDAV